MAGLFSSKKNKKDRDDTSSTNSGSNYNNSNQRYQQGGGRPSTASQSRDNFSANNSTSYSQSEYPYNNNNGSFQQSSSQQQLSNYQHQHSATSFSTHHSNGTSLTSGPWSSGMVMSTNPFPRFSHTASFVNTGNDIYIFGGIVKGSVQRDVHVIDTRKFFFFFSFPLILCLGIVCLFVSLHHKMIPACV